MSHDPAGSPRTFVVLYELRDGADRAAEALLALGLDPRQIAMRRASDFEVSAEKHGRSPVAAGLAEFLLPEPDRRSRAEGLGRAGAVLVAEDVPADLVPRARESLAAEALDVKEEPAGQAAPGGDADPQGAAGTLGGSGRATGTVDRLTGKPIGSPEAADDRGGDPDDERGFGGGGTATGEADRLSGEPTGPGRARRETN
jgi:hypothetical protein